MAAKINKNGLGSIASKAFYTILKDYSDDALYAGVSYISDTEWNNYTGSFDSDSTFWGGADSDFGPLDETYYNQAMYSMHKVYTGGISRVIPRSNWTYGETYNSYGNGNSYVLVREYVSGFSRINVYQCLFSPRTPSYYAPSGTAQLPVGLSDGYVWKYMYTIQNSEAIRFLNEAWMPVPEKIKQSDYASITSSSSNYDHYISQINAETGTVYSVSIDSDVLLQVRNVGSGFYDSDFNIAIQSGSVQLIGRDVETNTPTQTCKVKVTWDAAGQKHILALDEPGKGYVGPITFGVDSDSNAIFGITADVAPGNGHSADVPTELGANSVMIVSRNLSNDANYVVYDGSPYNLLSLHLNPVDNETGATATDEFYITCPTMTLDRNLFIVGDQIQLREDSEMWVEVIGIEGNKVYYVPVAPGLSTLTYSTGNRLSARGDEQLKQSIVTATSNRGIVLNGSQLLMADRRDTTVYRSKGQIEAFNFVITF